MRRAKTLARELSRDSISKFKQKKENKVYIHYAYVDAKGDPGVTYTGARLIGETAECALQQWYFCFQKWHWDKCGVAVPGTDARDRRINTRVNFNDSRVDKLSTIMKDKHGKRLEVPKCKMEDRIL